MSAQPQDMFGDVLAGAQLDISTDNGVHTSVFDEDCFHDVRILVGLK